MWRRVPFLAASALVLAGCATSSGSSSSGQCAAPSVTVSSSTVSPSQQIDVTGDAFVNGCADHDGVADGTPLSDQNASPMQDVEVQWVQGSEVQTLTTIDADGEGNFKVSVTVPADAAAGAAVIRVSPATDVEVDVES